jgi:hypothetical protein
MSEDDGFLSRWSRRKAEVRRGVATPEAPATKPSPSPAAAPPAAAVAAPVAAPLAAAATPPTAASAPPPGQAAPTLDDVALLTRESDYAPFVARGVGTDVKNAALKKLFSDPHFNIMDGLDTYIDDYGKPDPIPLAMLRQMTQTRFLGLFTDEDEKNDAATAPATAAAVPTNTLPPEPLPEPLPDENLDLRLQPHDVAGRAGPEPGTGEDAGRQL